MDLGIVGVGAITILCLFIGQIIKNTSLDNKWIPSICAGAGLILGIIAMYVMPGYPADNIITAAAVGVVSGLGATGANQAFKQIKEG